MPGIDLEDLIKAVKVYEENQISKILKIQGDTAELKKFLTIDNEIFSPEQLNRLDKMMNYIDKQSSLYREMKEKYDYQKTISVFMTGVENLLSTGGIGQEVINDLTKSQNFRDVVTSAIVGQFANTKPGESRFNNQDFNFLIQKGAKAETIGTIKRIFWAESKKTDKLKIDVTPVGSTGADEDIILKITAIGPRGGEKRVTLREDVKSSLGASYLASHKIYGGLKEVIENAAKNMIKNGKNIIVPVKSKELEKVLSSILGRKYGVVNHDGRWVANAAIFFTSPDNKIEMGSEVLQRKDFEIVINNTITKIAIRKGYINGAKPDIRRD